MAIENHAYKVEETQRSNQDRKAPLLSWRLCLCVTQLLICSEVLSGEVTLHISSSKQHNDRRDHNTNSLITLVKVSVVICSRRHFPFHSGRRELNGPRQQQQRRKNFLKKRKSKPPLTDGRPQNPWCERQLEVERHLSPVATKSSHRQS